MCGLLFADLHRPAQKRLLKRFTKQKNRGVEGFGCVAVKDGCVMETFRATDEKDIRNLVTKSEANVLLFHHRRPTSTPNLEECTHPIYVSNSKLKYDYYVIHNGVINNAKYLKEDFEKMGYEFTSAIELRYYHKGKKKTYAVEEKFNDSESFAIEIAQIIENGSNFTRSMGTIAFIALQVDKQTKNVNMVYFGRNTNPLKMEHENGELFLASEGTGKEINPHRLYSYDLKTKTIENSHLQIGSLYTPPTHTKTEYLPPKKEDTLANYMGFVKPDNKNTQNLKDYSLKKGNSDIVEDYKKDPEKYKNIVISEVAIDGDYGVTSFFSREKNRIITEDFRLDSDGFLKNMRIKSDVLDHISDSEWERYFSISKDIETIQDHIKSITEYERRTGDNSKNTEDKNANLKELGKLFSNMHDLKYEIDLRFARIKLLK